MKKISQSADAAPNERPKTMSEKLTIEQKLAKRRIHKPGVLYSIICPVFSKVVCGKYNIHVSFKADPRKDDRPHILIANHASRLDYMFTGMPLLPKKYNFVVGHNELYRSHLHTILSILQVIPKRNFVADIYCIKQIKRVISEGGNICIMPEGMSSISGHNQPVMIGTGKLIKHLGVPVYYAIISGGYLTSTKYCLDDRLGQVDVVFDLMFSPEEIKTISADEIEATMDRLLYHDDYEWNLKERHKFASHGQIAKDLHTLLWKCPRCGAEHKMLGEGDTIKCLACGNGATITEDYEMHPFDEGCVIPRTQTAWFDWERAQVKEEIRDPEFKLTQKVKLGTLPKYEYLKDEKTSEIVGEGVITLDHTGLSYDGTRDGAQFHYHADIKDIPTYGMCTDVSRFYTFCGGEFLEFYPDEPVVEKWFMATEELHRLHGGKWRDFEAKQ